jgi:hypothetical protein
MEGLVQGGKPVLFAGSSVTFPPAWFFLRLRCRQAGLLRNFWQEAPFHAVLASFACHKIEKSQRKTLSKAVPG